MSKRHLLAASSIGTLAAAAAVVAPVAAVAAPSAHGAQKHTSPSSSGISDDTTLETCSANFGGTKVTVGYFGKVRTAPSVTSARAGKPVKLEYRVEDSTNNCVMSEPENGIGLSWEVSCADPSTPLGTPELLAAPSYDEYGKHFEQRWTPPAGKNRCYLVTANAQIWALFRVK